MRNMFLVTFLTITFMALGALSPNQSSAATLEEKIGQMIMVGFRGLELSSDNPVVKDITGHGIGGVILFDYDTQANAFKRNIKSPDQVRELIWGLKNLPGGDNLFVAVAQDGGRTSPLKERYGFRDPVSQVDLGETDNIGITRNHAMDTAQELSELGINLNLVPVVDLNAGPEKSEGESLERSFSNDPEVVIDHSWEVINAHRIFKVLTAIKHFPGYGGAGKESHLNFPDATKTWKNMELIPYEELIQDPGCDMIMIGNIYNRRLDPEWPATLSEKTIKNVLRQEMGFEGVVITDDMQVEAIRGNYSLEVVLERAITAGVDIIMFGNNLVYEPGIAGQSMETIKYLIDQGRLTEDRINESYQRIMALKARLQPLVESDCSFCLK